MHLFKNIIFLMSLIPSLMFAINSDNFNFVTLSDIHLNTSQSNTMQINPDGFNPHNDMDDKSFNKLINSVTKTISKTSIKPDFILYLGDIVGHQNSSEASLDRSKFVIRNETAFFKKILKTNPNIPIINVFGNNDSSQVNYGDFQEESISPYYCYE